MLRLLQREGRWLTLGLELLVQPESPIGLRLSLDKAQGTFSRMADNRPIGQSQIE
jgi:hypothetical protein